MAREKMCCAKNFLQEFACSKKCVGEMDKKRMLFVGGFGRNAKNGFACVKERKRYLKKPTCVLKY